ncbi:hypothetical protein C5S53_08425 [Methanophagales archaeon]|nr:hypothetical protein C5S53_08425 [Methanophagales archaeon]
MFFNFDFFKSKTFSFGNVAQMTLNLALMGTLFILPVYMQQVLLYTAVETGIYLIPYSFSILFISFVTGPISQKFICMICTSAHILYRCLVGHA